MRTTSCHLRKLFFVMEKGRAPVVIMNLSYAFMERLAGARVVNVMQTSQENSLMLISHSPLKGRGISSKPEDSRMESSEPKTT